MEGRMWRSWRLWKFVRATWWVLFFYLAALGPLRYLFVHSPSLHFSRTAYMVEGFYSPVVFVASCHETVENMFHAYLDLWGKWEEAPRE